MNDMTAMTWVDWAIVIFMLLSILGGISQGFFRSVCSLGGLILGLMLAAWNYPLVAAPLKPLLHSAADRGDRDGHCGAAWSALIEGSEKHWVGLPGSDCRRNFWIFSGNVAGDAGDSGDRGVLSAGTLAFGVEAAPPFLRRFACKRADEPGSACGAREGRP
jgi:hypothetical protein